jgi:hypothetical protein
LRADDRHVAPTFTGDFMSAPRTAVTIALLALVSATGAAQRVPGAGYPTLFLGIGAFDYSLRSEGRSAMFAGRIEQELTTHVIGEAGVLYARVTQPGARESNSYLVPEAQLQLQHKVGWFAPYLGVGGGIALDFRPDSLYSNPTGSASVGIRARLSEDAALRSELRIRGVGGGREGGGSSRELVVGVLLRLAGPRP